MRLLVVSHYFWPENFRINDLTVELVQRGHHVTVLTGLPNYPHGSIEPEFLTSPESFANLEGVEVIRVPVIPRGRGRIRLMLNYASYAATACMLGAWKLRGREFDAILTYEPSPFTVGVPGVLLRTLKRAPMVFWVLDLWPETLRAVGVVKSERLLSLVGLLVSFVYRRCDLILAQSRSFIPEIARYGRDQQRIAYFPNWAEGIFASDVEPAPEVPIADDSFNVMFAGNIGEAQDFPTILDAAERLGPQSRVRWLIVGDGRMAPWVQAEVERRALVDRVLLLGRHPLERMPSFYKHADALLVSLKDEPIFALTIPGKLQSYLAAGIPVVAMLRGEGADVVNRSGAGISCAPGDAEGLAHAVNQLASLSPEDLEKLGRRARDVSEREFDRETQIARLESWLEQLHGGFPLEDIWERA